MSGKKSPLESKKKLFTSGLSEKAIHLREIAEKRVEQVFFVARDLEKKIVGVNTVYKQYNHQLDNYLYYYRTFISPRARTFQMTGEMMSKTKDYLEAHFVDNTDTEAIGMFLEVENEALKKKLNQAIWPMSKFVYIGKNKRGDHLRVYYFKNALIA